MFKYQTIKACPPSNECTANTKQVQQTIKHRMELQGYIDLAEWLAKVSELENSEG